MPNKRRRHAPYKKNPKPKHNTPNSKWRATCTYAELRILHPGDREHGDVQKICDSLRMPVTPRCLRQWYKTYRTEGNLTRKPGTGPKHIMDSDPRYREAFYLVYVRIAI
jgi:hypothetical protein